MMIENNFCKTDAILDLGVVDISNIQKSLAKLHQQDWDTELDYKTNYNKSKSKSSALHQTQHITLRFADKQNDLIHYTELPGWKFWAPVLLPAMNEITKYYGYEKGFYPKVMFAKLPPGGFIPPHVDGDIRGYAPHKIHVPIETNSESYFFLEKERHHLMQGRAYEVNNGKRHSVVNNGKSDRLHLIFEYLNQNIQSNELQAEMHRSWSNS